MQELIPAVESKFRVIREPWARMLSGGSTGGWIAAAHQVFYPDFYGGAFASCPDSVDFRYHQIVDIYKDANAYFIDKGWMKVERPNQQRARRQHRVDDEGREPLRARRRRQITIGRPVGHLGGDLLAGRRRRLSRSGSGTRSRDEIDKTVAESWRKYDLRHILETNWSDARTENRATSSTSMSATWTRTTSTTRSRN